MGNLYYEIDTKIPPKSMMYYFITIACLLLFKLYIIACWFALLGLSMVVYDEENDDVNHDEIESLDDVLDYMEAGYWTQRGYELRHSELHDYLDVINDEEDFTESDTWDPVVDLYFYKVYDLVEQSLVKYPFAFDNNKFLYLYTTNTLLDIYLIKLIKSSYNIDIINCFYKLNLSNNLSMFDLNDELYNSFINFYNDNNINESIINNEIDFKIDFKINFNKAIFYNFLNLNINNLESKKNKKKVKSIKKKIKINKKYAKKKKNNI